ncbi:SDR family NAD(P)-dependent oxidoreductase [Planomonospora sp. ID67723]|uniref:SDR family NAD(P)-dependent oxidoreductase n=1 Tax=Planomonospora sp. ID67723 TaxID=2738134 RepID=UPI0018C38309|nr:SDR family NAD(P)-dependent oxidoreductase [Planomonospora sp. ID67723]MBG0826672.1 SDR family NAD(P)-dependent oxidoreductase [Planomonospora sp. ID67723]
MENSETRPLAVVTGASSGIGYELARQFAEHGFDLVVAAEDEGIVEAARSLEELGAAISTVRVDLAHRDGVEELYTRATASGRPVDAVAINAGVGVSGDFARETDLDDELKLIKLNVVSSVHLAKRVLPDMVGRGRGRVLFTSSIAGTMPGPFHAVYAASKAFLYSFAEAVREELKDTGVTVTALLPGPTDTDFFRRAGMEDTKVGAGKKDDPAEVARQGFEALMSGDDHVVAGSKKNVLQSVAGKLMPETAQARMTRGMTEPGGADPFEGPDGEPGRE